MLRNNSKNWANESTFLNQTVGIGVREIYAKVRPGVWAVVPRISRTQRSEPPGYKLVARETMWKGK